MTRRTLPVYFCVRPGSNAGFCIGMRDIIQPAADSRSGEPAAYQVFGTAIEVASFGARFLPVLDIAGDNALGSRAEFQPLVAGFQAQRGTQPRNVYFGTQAEAHPRRLIEQLRRVWALLELFGEWGHGLRLGEFTVPRALSAFRVVLALLARFQAFQVIFQIVEKTHLLSRYDSPVSDFRTHLKALRDGLLRLHKSLLDRK